MKKVYIYVMYKLLLLLMGGHILCNMIYVGRLYVVRRKLCVILFL